MRVSQPAADVAQAARLRGPCEEPVGVRPVEPPRPGGGL